MTAHPADETPNHESQNAASASPSASEAARDPSVPETAIKRLTWIRLDGLGDGLFSASMLAPLAARFPAARITVVCRDSTAPLYEHCPHIAEVLTIQHGRAVRDPKYRAEIIAQIRQQAPELCLNSAYFPEALADHFCAGSGARDILGLDSGTRYYTPARHARRLTEYTRLIASPGMWKQELERYADFLRGLGIAPPPLAPMLWSSPEDADLARNLFTQNNLDPRKTLVLFASAALDLQVYPALGAAISDLCRQHGLSTIAIGDASGAAENQRQLAAAGVRALNLSGKLSLRQTAEVLRLCRLAVGNGTDSAHLACAVGTPHVVVLGGGQFGRFSPCSPLTSAVILPLSCFGCNWRCRQTRAHCVKDVQPEVVETAVAEALKAPGKHPRIYMQHWTFVQTPPRTEPFFVADMLPQMLLDLAYVMPADAPALANPPPALSGCPLRYIRVPRRTRLRRVVMRRV